MDFNKPVDFQRVLDHVKASKPFSKEDPIDPETIVSSYEELMKSMRGPSPEFKQELRDFVTGVAKRTADVRARFGLDKKASKDLTPVEKQLERLTLPVSPSE